jgi:hypothetical protein
MTRLKGLLSFMGACDRRRNSVHGVNPCVSVSSKWSRREKGLDKVRDRSPFLKARELGRDLTWMRPCVVDINGIVTG